MREAIKKRARESDQEVDPDLIVKQLVEEGILDDKRYLESQVRLFTETFSGKGPLALKADLQHKGGLSLEVIDNYIDESGPQWNRLARRICVKALGEQGYGAEWSTQIPDKLYFKIKRKLFQKGFTTPQVEYALEKLKPVRQKPAPVTDGTVKRWVEKRMAAGKGPYDIKQYLQQKGVEKAIINEELDIPDEVWFEIAIREREKRFGSNPPKNGKEKKKQSDFLLRRGFSSHLIREIMKQ